MTDFYFSDMELNTAMSDHEILRRAFHSFCNGLRSFKSEQARGYLERLKISYEAVPCGFISGQAHQRKDEDFVAAFLRVGLLKKSPTTNNPHVVFGKNGIVFALVDEQGSIVNLYADRFLLNEPEKVYMNPDDVIGIYPHYPQTATKKIVIVRDILSAATLLQSKAMDNRHAVIALMEGEVREQHIRAVENCAGLDEIILAGTDKTVDAYIAKSFPNTTVSKLNLPSNRSVNEIWKYEDQIGILRLLEERTYIANAPQEEKDETAHNEQGGLIHINAQKILYKGDCGQYFVQGNLAHDLGSMPITLRVRLHTGYTSIHKMDLYNVAHRHNLAKELYQHGVSQPDLEADLALLTLLLDDFRDERLEPIQSTKNKRIAPEISHERKMMLRNMLSDQDVLEQVDKLLLQSGIVGEDVTRLVLFIIASSYKTNNPLSAIVQASSGSGKSALINSVISCMPEEDVVNVTRVSGKAFYYADQDALVNKILVVQDMDGLHPDSLLAIREMQTAKYLISLRPTKDKATGNITTTERIVYANFALLAATTKSEIYYDNFSRSIILGIDESIEQTKRVVEYQGKKRSGVISKETEREARALLQDMMRQLQPYEVVNRFADKIAIPVEGMLLRRLNDQFLSFCDQVTFLRQYSRKTDEQGRLITEVEDVITAIELFFSVLAIKADDLSDPSLRQFFEVLKRYCKEKSPNGIYPFTARELRLALSFSKSHINRFLYELRQREYVSIVSGSANKGFVYQVTYWDDIEKLRQSIKENLLGQAAHLQ